MKTLLTLISIFTINGIIAQTIDKYVIASSGETLNTTNIHLTFMVGEPIVGTINNTVTIDQGFLVAASSNTVLFVEDELLNNAIKVYPNPVTEKLQIDLKNITGTTTISLYTLTGKLLKKATLNQQQNAMNLSNLASGVYLVRLHFLDYKAQKSFKIIKK